MNGLLSLMLLFAAPALAETPAMTELGRELASPAEARAAAVACGLSESQVKTAFEEFLQEDVVRISGLRSPTEDKMLECLARASLRTGYYTLFEDDDLQRRYWPTYFRLVDIASRADARAWVTAHGFDPLPQPEPGAPMMDWFHAFERLCGIAEGSFFAPFNDRFVTIAPEALGRFTDHGFEPGPIDEAQSECIFKVTEAADLASHGVGFGLIGNERYGDE